MILIITHKEDYTVDFVINKLNEAKINYKRLNCEDLISKDYQFNSGKNFTFEYDGIQNFKSVWFRRTRLPEINNLKREEIIYLSKEYEALLKNIFSTIDAKWLSEPRNVYNAENKILQLKTAQKLGFQIPPTLITNKKDQIKSFYLQNDRNIIIKPLASTRIIYEDGMSFIFTNPVSEKFISSINEFDINPCIFQQNIEKEYEIRVTVVDKKVFASSVDSQKDEETKIDWRKKKLEFEKTNLPKDIEDKCIRLLENLNLKFGAIDLIKKPNGDFVFLEINPNGQWAWIEMQTGQKISQAIINYLENVKN